MQFYANSLHFSILLIILGAQAVMALALGCFRPTITGIYEYLVLTVKCFIFFYILTIIDI